jgi:hypothetical protein
MSDVRTFMSFEKASSRPYELSLYEMLYELYEGGEGGRTDREIVEAAPARGAEVVRQHRAYLARLYRISHTLAKGIECCLSGCRGVPAMMSVESSPVLTGAKRIDYRGIFQALPNVS